NDLHRRFQGAAASVVTRRRSICITAGFALVMLSSPAAAQETNTQFWSELTAEWIKSHAWTLKVLFEPRTIVSEPADQEGWTRIEFTPSAEYSRWKWVDFTGDLVTAHTSETDDVSTTEITPRLGVRLHLLSTVRDNMSRETRPKY